MAYEVEVKYRLREPARLRLELELLGATKSPMVSQTDVYFRHPNRDYARTDEALRIRRQDGRLKLAYKGPKVDSITKTREEIELEIGSGLQDFEQARQLFERLGFSVRAKVQKKRDAYEIRFDEQEIAVAVDEVEGVGTFVELEALADADELDEVRQKLLRLAERLDLRESERRSYLELLLAPRES